MEAPFDLPEARPPDIIAQPATMHQHGSSSPGTLHTVTSRPEARARSELPQVTHDASLEQPAARRAGVGAVLKDVEGYNSENRMLFFAKVLRSATEAEVKSLFAPFGRVYDVNMFRAFQGAPTTKGCGLVTMGSHDEAQAAINALDNKYVWEGMESPMVVKWMDAALQRRRREQHLAAMRSGLIPSHSMGSASTLPGNWLPTGFALANMLPHPRTSAYGLPPSASIPMLAELDAPENPPAGCHPDAIKLFVGNIPKSCREQQLLPFFETVGKVVELVIVRDKTFHESKGSAFVWYATRALAERAILQFNLRHVLPDPTGEQTRPLVVRKAKMRSPSSPMLPMSLSMMAGGSDSGLLEHSVHLGPGPHMSQAFMDQVRNAHRHYAPHFWQPAGPVGPGMLGGGLDAIPPPPPPPQGMSMSQRGLGWLNTTRFGASMGGSQHMGQVMPGLQSAGSNLSDEAGLTGFYEAYGSDNQQLNLLHDGGSSGIEVDQVIMSAAVSQSQLSLINSHLFSVQTMSGAQLNIMIGAPGIFHLVVSGTKAQVDSARALLYSVIGSS